MASTDPRDPDYKPPYQGPVPPQGSSYQNNIDWNNTLTGSPRNTINLNIDELRGSVAVTNAVDKPVEKDK